jgi:hypothetical protein
MGEQKNWELQAKLQTVAPESVQTGEEADEKKQNRMLIKAEAEWGSEHNNQVNVRIQGEPTRKTYWKSDSGSRFSRFLNKFDMVAEYKLHSQQRHYFQRVFELLKVIVIKTKNLCNLGSILLGSFYRRTKGRREHSSCHSYYRPDHPSPS